MQKAIELEETQCVAESLLVAQNANEEELALLEEEMDGMGLSSSVSPRHSWRASACLGGPIGSITATDTRRQFQNLVHIWAENGESSSSTGGKFSQYSFNSKYNTQRTAQAERIAPRSQTQRDETNKKAAVVAASKRAGSKPTSTKPIDGNLIPPTTFPYRARAKYSYQANTMDPQEISFSENEIIEVANLAGNWWRAKKENGTTGIVPSNYLVIARGKERTPIEIEYKYRAKAIDSWRAVNSDEISFFKNEILEIADITGKWWEARRGNGDEGIAYSMYLLLL